VVLQSKALSFQYAKKETKKKPIPINLEMSLEVDKPFRILTKTH